MVGKSAADEISQARVVMGGCEVIPSTVLFDYCL